MIFCFFKTMTSCKLFLAVPPSLSRKGSLEGRLRGEGCEWLYSTYLFLLINEVGFRYPFGFVEYPSPIDKLTLSLISKCR